MTIVESLQNALYKSEMCNCKLSSNEINYMNTLLTQHPELFEDSIQTLVREIMSDGVIDIHDVPNIILLISRIFNSNVISHMIHTVNVFKLVEFVIDALLDSGILPLSSNDSAVIRRVVDTSLNLLDTNLNFIKKSAPIVGSSCCC